MATRTAEEVFAHHDQARGAGRLDDIVDEDSDDSILTVNDEILRGPSQTCLCIEGMVEPITQLGRTRRLRIPGMDRVDA